LLALIADGSVSVEEPGEADATSPALTAGATVAASAAVPTATEHTTDDTEGGRR